MELTPLLWSHQKDSFKIFAVMMWSEGNLEFREKRKQFPNDSYLCWSRND